jgi:hypothetical protein
VHGARRATCFQLGDMCTNRCRPENNLSQPEPNKLSYEEIIRGTRYKTNQSPRTAKRWKKTGSTLTEDNLSHADSNSNMEQEERRRAEREAACWYVPCLGTIPQVRPEGVFRLVGGNLNCASTKCEDSYTKSLCCDSAFAHKKELYIFKLPERFLEISCAEISLFS